MLVVHVLHAQHGDARGSVQRANAHKKGVRAVRDGRQRLLVADAQGIITRLDPAGQAHARRAGFDWQVGSLVSRAELEQVAYVMADTLVRVLTGRYSAADLRECLLTDPIEDLGDLAGLMFSGGVGEYVYGREDRDFGDLGKLFGEALRSYLDAGVLPWPLLAAG